MSDSTPKAKVGVYIDYENIHISLEKQNKKCISPAQMGRFRDVASAYGRVVSAKAFASWDDLYPYQKALEEHGIVTVNVFSQSKNAADIAMVVDCMDAVLRDDIDAVVLFAGDGGYAPLINHLIDRHGKDVYVCAVKSSTSATYARLKERLLVLDDVFVDALTEPCVIDEKVLQLVRLIDQGEKKLPYVARRLFLKYVMTLPLYKDLDIDACGLMLNEAIRQRLIITEDQTESGKDYRVQVLKVNHEHPTVKGMALR